MINNIAIFQIGGEMVERLQANQTAFVDFVSFHEEVPRQAQPLLSTDVSFISMIFIF